MPDIIQPFVAISGLAVGITATSVITDTANLPLAVSSFNGLTGAVTGVTTSVANIFTAIQTFNAGITAAGATFTGPVIGNSGFTFGAGAGLSFMAFYPKSAFNGGGLWIRDGQLQMGGSVFGSQGSFYFQPASERFYVFGAADFNQSYDYEQGRSPLRLNVGPNHLRPILAAYVQTVQGTQLSATHNDTNMVAGIDNKGVLFSTAGISASGGVTFSGTISLNGQTLTNVVSSVNGITGSISSLRAPAGLTNSIGVFTYPNGVTSYSDTSTPYYSSPYHGARAVSTGNMVANRTYWVLQQTPRNVSIKNIRVSANSPGVTGNVYFSVWSVNPNNGLPATRLYSGPAPGVTATASVFNYVTLTNASGLVNVPAGPFYIAATFSTALPTHMHSTDRGLAIYGSANYVTGYMNYLPVLDSSGFTTPTSINQAGTTFGFIDYYPTSVTVPILEWNHV